MRFDVLELASIPQSVGELRALLNEAKDQRRRARRRRLIGMLLIVFAALLWWLMLGPALASSPAIGALGLGAYVVLIGWFVLRLLRRQPAPRPTQLPQADAHDPQLAGELGAG